MIPVNMTKEKDNLSYYAKMMGRKAGKASVKSRFKGLTSKQISEKMREVSLAKNKKLHAKLSQDNN